MKNSDRYVSIAILGLAGLWTFLTFQIKDNSLPGAPGPRFFPFLVIICLTLCVIGLLVSTYKKKAVPATAPAAKQVAEATGDGACDDIEEPKPIPRRMIYSFIAMFAYVVATALVGFYVATVPFLIVVLKGIMKTKSWIHTLIGTAVITGVIYLIFTVFFKLSLPAGSLW